MGDGDEEEAELRCLSAVETVASGKGGRGGKGEEERSTNGGSKAPPGMMGLVESWKRD